MDVMKVWRLETEKPKAAVVNGSLLLVTHTSSSIQLHIFSQHLLITSLWQEYSKVPEYSEQTGKVSVLKKFPFHPLNIQLSKFHLPTPHSTEIPLEKSLLLYLSNKMNLNKNFL